MRYGHSLKSKDSKNTMQIAYDDQDVTFDSLAYTYDGDPDPDFIRLVASSAFVCLDDPCPFTRIAHA